MISIKQIKSDVTGPILFQGTSNIKRSLDLIWDDTLKEFQINGDVVFKNTWNASNLHIKAGATLNDITYVLPITDPIAGQVLMASLPVSGVSTLSWTSTAGGIGTADNGLSVTMGNVQLGGTLIQDTIIDGATNAWSMLFNNVKSFTANSNSFNLNSQTFIDNYAVGDINDTGLNHLGTYTNSYTTVANDITIASTLLSVFSSDVVMLQTITSLQLSSINTITLDSGAGGIILSTNTGGSISLASVTDLFMSASGAANLSLNMYNTAQTVTNNGVNNSMIVTDLVNSKGIVYAADYSANFTPESLVSKRYVDSVSGGGGSMATADNGLTSLLGNVQLGGALIINTDITGAFDLQLGTNTNRLNNALVNASVQISLDAPDTIVSGNFNASRISGAVTTTIYEDGSRAAFNINNSMTGETEIILAEQGSGISLMVSDGVNNNMFVMSLTGVNVINNGTNNSMVIYDAITSKGIVYAADYSANFTDESLVSKRYVDTAVTGGALTASNGLTKVVNDVQLGGLLTANTTIDGAFDLNFGTAGANSLTNLNTRVSAGGSVLTRVGGSAFGQFQATDNNVSMVVQTAITGNSVYVDAISATLFSLAPGVSTVQISTYNVAQTISDGSTNNYLVIKDDTAKGIAYYADYSTNFTNESLVTKRYVTAALAASGASSLSSVLTTGNTSGGLNILFTAGSGIDTTATAGTDTLNIGTTNADVINIGRSGATVNIFGTRTFVQTTDTEFIDALIRLNKNGAASTGTNTGFEIEENAAVTGYLKTNGTRNGWLFKAPASFQFQLDSTALTANCSYVMPNNGGTLALLSDITAITGTTNRITVAAGVVNIAPTYVGQSSITTLGTITTGTWNGTVIANAYITSTLSSKTLDNTNTVNLLDTLFTLQDNTDTTKQMRFELSNISAATTRVITVPDADGTLSLCDGLFKSSVTTTNNTSTTVHTIPTSSNIGYLLQVRVIARKASGAGVGVVGDTDGYVRNVKAKNVGGVVTLGTVQSTYTNEDTTIHDVTVTVSGTNILVNVVGTVNNSIIWQIVSEWIKI